MKAEEKINIFNLLKTCDSYINGFSSPAFLTNPEFMDDKEPENLKEQITSMENEVVQTNIESTSSTIQSNNSQFVKEDYIVSSNENVKNQLESKEIETKIEIPKPVEEKSSSLSLSDLNAKIIRCTRCNLARTRNNVVPGMGVDHPDVLVIGEGPGADEDLQGLPFVGKAGILLDKMLAAIQLDRRTNCYIANIVKCRPPQNRDPLPEEQATCIGFLEAQISILKPKMILCMGRVAGHKLLNNDLPMNKMHGILYSYNDIPLMVTYHPSALLRDEALKRPAWEDLKLFKLKLDELKQK